MEKFGFGDSIQSFPESFVKDEVTMNTIDKTRLVQTSVESLLRETSPAQKKAESTQSGETAGAEAVKVDAGFGSGAASDPKKIAALQQQINAGQYNPDLNKVATAIARDLL